MVEFANYKEPEYRINDKKGVIIGRSEIMLDLFHYLNHLANLPTTVLLRGETGTGKELCAKSLHYNGKARNKYVAVNCAGIPSELLESELFGYVKGAFTGAVKNTSGKFQHAQGGTILLDEIGDMSPKLQAKVLRVLQEKQITRVGSNEAEDIDVRVVAATNRNLERMVEKGNFREDLYYRLNVVPVQVPALQERTEDIPLIAEHFIKKYNSLYENQREGLTGSAKEKLQEATWKGNVRELENVIERAFVLPRNGPISADDLYFNSDMPRKLFNYSTKTSKNSLENISSETMPSHCQIIETPGEKLWYQEGVLPISPTEISKYEGAKSYPTILETCRDNCIHTQTIGNGSQRVTQIVYLTPQTLPNFFREFTDAYNNLLTEIQNDEFNLVVEEPFMLLSTQDIIKLPGTYKSNISIETAASRSGAYEAKIGNLKCYAINHDNASHFIPKTQSHDENTLSLMETIQEENNKFVSWTPSELFAN